MFDDEVGCWAFAHMNALMTGPLGPAGHHSECGCAGRSPLMTHPGDTTPLPRRTGSLHPYSPRISAEPCSIDASPEEFSQIDSHVGRRVNGMKFLLQSYFLLTSWATYASKILVEQASTAGDTLII